VGDHLNYHRYQWFDRQVRAEKYPNARHLAEKFEISKKAAHRNIEFFRDRLRLHACIDLACLKIETS
jgi:hypothetical protein